MLNRAPYIAIVLATVLLAADGLSPTEEKMVGTWQIIGSPVVPEKFRHLRFRYYADHTFETLDCSREKPVVLSTGTWRIEGNDLFTDERRVPRPGESPPPTKVGKATIRVASVDRIAFIEGMVIERVTKP